MTTRSTHDDYVAILSDSQLFGELSRRELSEIVEASTVREFSAGTMLQETGQHGTSIYCVLEGLLHAEIPANERPRLIIGQSELCGAAGLVFPHRYLVTVRAGTNVRVLDIDITALLARSEQDEGFGFRLMRGLARDAVHRLSEIFADAAGHPTASYVPR